LGIALTPISNNQMFGTWLQRTNDLIAIISGNVYTSDGTAGGAVTSGNAFANGFFGGSTIWAGNSSTNVVLNAISISTSFGFSTNSVGAYHNTTFFANSFNAGSIANSSGFYGTTASVNSITVASVLSVNSTAANVTTLTASANVIANNAQITSLITVGAGSTINTTAYVVGQMILNTANLVLGGTASVLNQNVFIANTSGNISIGPVGFSTSWGLSANTTRLFANGITVNTLFVNTSAVGNSTGFFTANLTSNATVTVGNSSVNVVANSTTITTANAVVTNLYVNSISSNAITSNTTITAGNSTVNCAINSTTMFLGNSTYIDISANSTGVYTNGNMTVSGNFFVSGSTTTTGTTTGTGDFIPSSNVYNLGNTTNRWTLWALAANLVGNVSMTGGTSTIIIGNSSVNATVNSTVYSATANNTSFVGAVSAANIVSNAQLSANLTPYATQTQLQNNLANYPTSTQLTNNLANYQTTAGLNANIAAYLPNYTGVLNSSSLSALTSITIGNSTVNTVANATVFKVANSTVTFSFGAPTSSQVTNGQYVYTSAGTWSLPPTQTGNVLTSGTTTQNIDSWAMASFYAAEYLIDVGDNNANNRTFTKILLTHDSNNSFITEYSTIATNSSMGVFESTSNSTVVTLNFTPVSTNTTVRWCRTII